MMKAQKQKINGIVLLDKPIGMSSNHALQAVKRIYMAEKAGHAGTLDPLASGMLPICLGQATKLAEYLLAEDKCYRATIQLGVATATGDTEGEIIAKANVPSLDKSLIDKVLAQFRGAITQTPPMYSALKHQGVPLYKLARQGEIIERKAREVQIYQLDLMAFAETSIVITVKCSKGTYIRTLAEDIAKAMGTVGHLTALRRLYSGGFNADAMQTLENLKVLSLKELSTHILPLSSLLPAWPKIAISFLNYRDLLHGKPLILRESVSGQFRLFLENKLIAIAKIHSGEVIDRKLLCSDLLDND